MVCVFRVDCQRRSFIFLETFDTDSYLPQITRQASKILGRVVTIGHVALGISWDGIILDAGPVVIADDGQFTSQPFIRVDRVHVGLDIVSLIVHREIRMTDVLLQSPEIHIIRSQEGLFNIHSIVGPLIGDKTKPVPGDRLEANPRQASVSSNRLNRDSTLFFKIGGSGHRIRIRDAAVCFIDQSENFPLDIWVSDINVDIDDFSLTKPFRLSIKASTLSQVPNLSIGAAVSLNNSNVAISDLTVRTDLAGLDSHEVKGLSPGLAHISLPTHFTGKIAIDAAHVEMGTSTALTAGARLTLTDCGMEDFAITQMILSPMLGTMSEIFALPDHFLDGPLNGQWALSVHDGAVFIEDSWLQTKNFDLTFRGSVDKGLNTNVKTMLRLSSDVSLSLAGKVKMLQYVMDENKRITIPAHLSGVFPHLAYKLDKDFRKKIKKAFAKEGPQQMINDVLNNFLR